MDRARLDALRLKKLQSLLRHAHATVPYYRNMLDEAGVAPESIRTLADLSLIPVSRKDQFQHAGAGKIITAEADANLVRETTSGSSGRPFDIHFDRHWLDWRSAMFMRALMAAGYRPGHRMLLISGQAARPATNWLKWRRLPYNATQEELIADLCAFKPAIVYGWVTPLRRMAERILATGTTVSPIRSVIVTAETLDKTTKEVIEAAFHTQVHEIYGMTEMGAMAWSCAEGGGYHLAEDSIIAELLPHESRAGFQRLVLTNLELRSQPFIRYDCGDLAVPAADDKMCVCRRTFRRLQRLEGRLADCITRPDGTVFSPFELTLAIERVPGIHQFQITQRGPNRLMVKFVAAADAEPATITRAIRDALVVLLGTDMEIIATPSEDLSPAPGEKFRVVVSDTPAANED